MPQIVRVYIKAALAYFAIGLLAGFLLAAREALNLSQAINSLSPVYFHIFMVGWVTQLIMGIALWMFPKFTIAEPRGSERVNWAVFYTLNAGLLLRIVAEPLMALNVSGPWGPLLVVSALLQWLAGMGFIANAWRRVKEK
jgi:hypothetical protein